MGIVIDHSVAREERVRKRVLGTWHLAPAQWPAISRELFFNGLPVLGSTGLYLRTATPAATRCPGLGSQEVMSLFAGGLPQVRQGKAARAHASRRHCDREEGCAQAEDIHG